MHITIQHHNDQFNIDISSKPGADAFLSIKGCRIVDGQKGRFVSFPSRKQESGKYWSHVWASDRFQVAVIDAYDASKRKQAAAKAAKQVEEDDDIPF